MLKNAKKLIALLLVFVMAVGLFAGCGGEKSLETVGDVPDAPAVATEQQVLLQEPKQRERQAHLQRALPPH